MYDMKKMITKGHENLSLVLQWKMQCFFYFEV